MRVLVCGVAVVAGLLIVARPHLDHRALSLAEQAAIAGGEKGQTCAQPASGTTCNDTDTSCSGLAQSCVGKMAGDECQVARDFMSPDRCAKTQDEDDCCDDQGEATTEQVVCFVDMPCRCVDRMGMLFCDPTEEVAEEPKVAKCVDASGDDCDE